MTDYIILCAHQFPSPGYDLPTPFPKGKAIFPCSFGALVEMTDFGFSQMSGHTEAEASEIWCHFLNFLKRVLTSGGSSFSMRELWNRPGLDYSCK